MDNRAVYTGQPRPRSVSQDACQSRMILLCQISLFRGVFCGNGMITACSEWQLPSIDHECLKSNSRCQQRVKSGDVELEPKGRRYLHIMMGS